MHCSLSRRCRLSRGARALAIVIVMCLPLTTGCETGLAAGEGALVTSLCSPLVSEFSLERVEEREGHARLPPIKPPCAGDANPLSGGLPRSLS